MKRDLIRPLHTFPYCVSPKNMEVFEGAEVELCTNCLHCPPSSIVNHKSLFYAQSHKSDPHQLPLHKVSVGILQLSRSCVALAATYFLNVV